MNKTKLYAKIINKNFINLKASQSITKNKKVKIKKNYKTWK